MAVAAEDAGADTVMVMDHFYQLAMMGPPELEMFEAYTLLGALAARTDAVKLGTLVTGVTYRNPAILAKIVTTLDVISSGRAFLGIGAAWFDVEHEGLGVDFPPVKERFERLEEALHICRAMFRGERPTIEGKHYRVKDAINSPAPVTPGGPPIMIGGQGEKKTLRLMAEHAEMANFTSGFDEIPRKLEVLAAALRRRRPRPGHHQQDLAVLGRGGGDDGGRRGACETGSSRARGMDWDTPRRRHPGHGGRSPGRRRCRRGGGAGPGPGRPGARRRHVQHARQRPRPRGRHPHRAWSRPPSASPAHAGAPPDAAVRQCVPDRRSRAPEAVGAAAASLTPLDVPASPLSCSLRASGPFRGPGPKIETDVRAGLTPSGTARHNP